MALHPWFDRTFTLDLPLWMAPDSWSASAVRPPGRKTGSGSWIPRSAFFAAEHDDHHLAKVTELLKAG